MNSGVGIETQGGARLSGVSGIETISFRVGGDTATVQAPIFGSVQVGEGRLHTFSM